MGFPKVLSCSILDLQNAQLARGSTWQMSLRPRAEKKVSPLHTPERKVMLCSAQLQYLACLDAFGVQTNLSPTNGFIRAGATIAAVKLQQYVKACAGHHRQSINNSALRKQDLRVLHTLKYFCQQ
jgi:hypothetical protein